MMNKKIIFLPVISLLMIAAMTACAAPVSQNVTNTTGNAPATGTPATGTPVISPGIPTGATGRPTQGGAGIGIATPVALAPNVGVAAPGAGYVTSPSILSNGQYLNSGIQVTGMGQVMNKIIAATLGITLDTTKKHVRNVIDKLQAPSRTHAAIIAAQVGIVGNPINDASPVP